MKMLLLYLVGHIALMDIVKHVAPLNQCLFSTQHIEITCLFQQLSSPFWITRIPFQQLVTATNVPPIPLVSKISFVDLLLTSMEITAQMEPRAADVPVPPGAPTVALHLQPLRPRLRPRLPRVWMINKTTYVQMANGADLKMKLTLIKEVNANHAMKPLV